ncbi:unnamed protein product [Moneuplotes crassus]|uniref:Cytochrome c oxidase assembly protein COX15 n=1 Tax=Euplotes crassus TaxID=5936 RepID=A0AAD1UTU4_EUPCR|nr:unnamed protein product [Moneuplotes crassus]
MLLRRGILRNGIGGNLVKRHFSTKNYVTKDATRFVKDGKRIQVGIWLLGTSFCVFALTTRGGYTRNMRFGIPTIQWKGSGNTPKTDEQWEEKYEEFKKYPEYTARGKPTTLEQFKQAWILNKAGMIFGPGAFLGHALPMAYFLARGYFKGPMKKFCAIYTGLVASIGFQGMYMDKKRPGAVEGAPTPAKDKHQKAIHYTLIGAYFGYGFWMALNMLRGSPDHIKRLDRFFAYNSLRKHMTFSTHFFFTLVLLSGFLTAGTGSGRSITTYPKVGDKWAPAMSDLDQDSSFLENILNNNKLIQFNHRTLGLIMTGVVGIQWVLLMRTKLGFMGKLGLTTLFALLLGQLHIGSYMVTHGMQPENTMTHAGNGYLIFATILYLMHLCRKPNPAVIKKIAAQFKERNPGKYEAFTKRYAYEMSKVPK